MVLLHLLSSVVFVFTPLKCAVMQHTDIGEACLYTSASTVHTNYVQLCTSELLYSGITPQNTGINSLLVQVTVVYRL